MSTPYEKAILYLVCNIPTLIKIQFDELASYFHNISYLSVVSSKRSKCVLIRQAATEDQRDYYSWQVWGAYHSTQTSDIFETRTIGAEISCEKFQKIRKLLSHWTMMVTLSLQ